MARFAEERKCASVSPPLPYEVRVELGSDWTVEQVDDLLSHPDGVVGSARVLRVAEHFLRRSSPFVDESDLPEPPEGCLAVRFASLDCITFVYLVHAAAAAANRRKLFENLRRIRYSGAPSPANLIHYTYNSVARMLALGWVHDVTAELVAPERLATRTVRLGVKADGEWFLGKGFGNRGDRNCGSIVSQRYIPSAGYREVEDRLESGDTLLLVSSRDPGEYPGIVRHAVFAVRLPERDHLAVLHCGKSRVGGPDGDRAGVSILGAWDAERQVLVPGSPPRPLQTYLEQHPSWWCGFVVLRGAQGGPPPQPPTA